jgi:xylose isomerase
MKGFSVGVWAFGMGSDRYVDKGYKPYRRLEERVQEIRKLPGVNAVEVTFPNDVNMDTLAGFKKLLSENNLTLAAMGVELVCDAEWASGSFTSPDPARRQKSIELTCAAMDCAAALGIQTVNLWLGQDGFDYVFQMDYAQSWDWLVSGLRTCALHRPEIQLGVEYKVSEPKLNCLVNSGGKALALAYATGQPNVGVCLDIGHAFNARENPAEIACILLRENRLFHLHFNDNYGLADDDMPVGTVHWPQFFELLYWLETLGYSGWYSLDIYPYRDSSAAACEASLNFLQTMRKVVTRPGFGAELPSLRNQAPSRILNWLLQETLGKVS